MVTQKEKLCGTCNHFRPDNESRRYSYYRNSDDSDWGQCTRGGMPNNLRTRARWTLKQVLEAKGVPYSLDRLLKLCNNERIPAQEASGNFNGNIIAETARKTGLQNF